jgi:hypothetical protein
MKHMSNNFRLGAVAGLAMIAISGLFGACNSHPVEFTQATNAISVHSDVSPDTAAAVDILWVIDNSGTMCEEQSALRTNFKEFISQITDRNIDFHLGVTTTQMDPYVLEPVAQAGHLQSTPQPLPSPIPSCHGDKGDEDDPNDPMDNYQPIREAIDLAVECTKDPAKWESLTQVTDDYIECQMVPGLARCSCNDDPDDNDVCSRNNLFPTYDDGSPYRDIDKVLKFSDYLDPTSGQLDDAQRAKLEADFACMSFVGTSGNSVEKGLAAVELATSPEMTGGTVENPTDESAPNFGFLRDSAKFSVIFVTDETDCSHDGTLDEGTSCGDDVCAFANHPDLEGESPLIPSEKFATDVIQNLTDSKGYDVANESIIAASIHGNWRRYGAMADYPSGEPPATNTCTDLPSESIAERPSCDTEFGSAYSGDRYERFLRQFENVFPKKPDDPNQRMKGLICSPQEIATTLEQIGETIAGTVSSCIDEVPSICTTSDDCPTYSFGEGTAECLPFGESGKSYCNSGIQVRLYPGAETTLADVESHEYCVPGSVDSQLTPGGCVVDPAQYSFEACPGAETLAINLNWTDSRYFNTLSGYKVELVYRLLTEPLEPAAE